MSSTGVDATRSSGLGIGETEYWSKGYGTDVMNVLLRFAFTEVNLRRVTLTVFEYNPRAIRSYEKAGFRHEGRLRSLLNREGRRWDELFMGISVKNGWKCKKKNRDLWINLLVALPLLGYVIWRASIRRNSSTAATRG